MLCRRLPQTASRVSGGTESIVPDRATGPRPTGPRYASVATALRAELAGRSPGDTLPTEQELTARFGVSRFTVRAALQVLVDEGLIERRRGSGTVVAAGNMLRQSLGDLRDLLQYAAASSFEIHDDGPVALTAARARSLGRPTGERWHHFTGIRRLDNAAEPIAVTDVYLHPRFAHLARRLVSGRETLFAQIRRLAGVSVARVTQEICAIAASPREAEALGIARRSPCLRIVRVYFDARGEPIEMSASVHPGGRFSYAMELGE
jgi:DNA-binding GntR family transcriptional regulator